MNYILYAVLYLIAGRGVWYLYSVIQFKYKLPNVKCFKIFTILVWHLFILYVGIS
jgi:hypothetical protein